MPNNTEKATARVIAVLDRAKLPANVAPRGCVGHGPDHSACRPAPSPEFLARVTHLTDDDAYDLFRDETR